MKFQVRFGPSGEQPYDEEHHYVAVPRCGDRIADKHGNPFIIVTVDWGQHLTADHTPFIIAHSPDRPRAEEARRSVDG
jgi:hypothetical protein